MCVGPAYHSRLMLHTRALTFHMRASLYTSCSTSHHSDYSLGKQKRMPQVFGTLYLHGRTIRSSGHPFLDQFWLLWPLGEWPIRWKISLGFTNFANYFHRKIMNCKTITQLFFYYIHNVKSIGNIGKKWEYRKIDDL